MESQTLEAFRTRITQVKESIAQACTQFNRPKGSVELLAVSKSQPAASVAMMHSLGVTSFGENYAQEMVAKAQLLANLPIRWVYIGTLQSNKIPLIVRHCSEIQSLASMEHARLIARAAQKNNKLAFPVYLLINAAGETSKSGISIAEAPTLATQIREELPELAIQGIMAIPPPLSQIAQPKQLYVRLRQLANSIGAGKLSLGMSSDLELAISAGSDCVRIGTNLFGPRIN
jgi:PLP dependent protein